MENAARGLRDSIMGLNQERFLALRGTASDFAETLPEATKADYEALKDAIKNHFKINESKVLQWEEIQGFSLKTGQSVTGYFDELRKLANRLGVLVMINSW